MSDTRIWIYILIMAAVTYSVRVLPMLLIRGKIKNRFIQSFLHYVPYVTLSVMTVPAIFEATKNPVSGIIALVAGVILSFKGCSMFIVASVCPVIVFISEYIISLL